MRKRNCDQPVLAIVRPFFGWEFPSFRLKFRSRARNLFGKHTVRLSKTSPVSLLLRRLPLLGAFIFPALSPAFADALDNWTTNQVSTNYFGLDHVAYAKGRYVAYGWY